MGWVVKSWRTEWLDARATADARREAHEILLRAERQARLLTRVAAREVADAEAYLKLLEGLGAEAHRGIVERRRGLRSEAVAVEVEVEPRVTQPEPEPAPAAPAADDERPARGRKPRRRATLRESPLSELFRATSTA